MSQFSYMIKKCSCSRRRVLLTDLHTIFSLEMYQKSRNYVGKVYIQKKKNKNKQNCNALSKIEVHHYILHSPKIGGFASPILAIGSHL